MVGKADIGEEFKVFLLTYDKEGYYTLANPDITDADINHIFDRNKARFDAWRKIPQRYRDGGELERRMLDKAMNDPNFTETDAVELKEEYDKKINPYSPIPKDLEEHPIYQDLIDRGMKITPAHIAAMGLLANELMDRGYSNAASEKISQNSILRKVLFTERDKVEKDSSLSDAEKEKFLTKNAHQIDETRLLEDNIRKDDAAINMPERMLTHALRELQRGKISKGEASLQVDLYLKQIIARERLGCLQAEMEKSLYKKVLKPENKEILTASLATYQIDFSETKNLSAEEKIKTPAPQNTPQTQLEQRLLAMRHSRGLERS